MSVNLLYEVQRLDDLRQILSRNFQSRSATQANSNENRVKLLFQFAAGNFHSYFHPTAKLDTQSFNHLHFLEARPGRHFVIGDTVCVQPAGVGLFLEDYREMPELSQFRSATESSRSSANNRDFLARLFRARLENLNTVFID